MPKNKQVRNAFFFYMLAYKEEQEAQGRRRFKNLAEVAEAAGPSWLALPPSVRAKYEQQAKDYKNQSQTVKKYNSKGECLDDVQRRKQDMDRAELIERNNISKLITSAVSGNSRVNQLKALKDLRTSSSNETEAKRGLPTIPLCLIDVNYYCETKDRHVVNEVALMMFTIANGVECIYHTIVDPGEIPAGFAYEAKMSFDVHQLPPPPLDMGQKDYVKILSTIDEFLFNYKGQGRELPYLFTMTDSVAPVKSFLNEICGRYEDPDKFRVYQLKTLFHELTSALKNAANEGLPTESLAQIQLQKDQFQYHQGLGCAFHEDTEKYYNCCKARVKRWAFTILDYCCPLANIEMVPGDHVPEEVDLKLVAQVKERLEDERERRVKESSMGFQFINYANMSLEDAAPAPQPPPQVAPPAKPLDTRSWPGLGRAPARAPASAPAPVPAPALGAWGKPAVPAGSSAAAVVAAPKRRELRKPMSIPGVPLPEGIDDQPWIQAGRGRQPWGNIN